MRLALGECDGPCLVEDLEVGAVVEDAAAGTGEDAPSRARRVFLQVLGEKRDQLGMKGHETGFSAWPVLQLAALPGRSAVSPPRAAPGLGVGQNQLAPSLVGQADEIVEAQIHDFLRPQRGVVDAAEEGDHPLAALVLLANGRKQPPRLVTVDHGSWVHRLEGPRASPLDGL